MKATVAAQTDAELLARLRAGDDAAGAELYARHRPFVFDFLARRLGNVEVAEGLVHEAFVRVLQRSDEIRNFRAFLLTIARNLATDRQRRDRRVPPEPVRTVELFDTQQVELSRLRDAVAELPEDCREVVELRYQRQLSFAEIARELAMSKNGVFARHNRALDLLRARFRKPRKP